MSCGILRLADRDGEPCFASGSGVEPRLFDHASDCVDYHPWLPDMYVVIRISGHHLGTLRRQSHEISLHVFPRPLNYVLACSRTYRPPIECAVRSVIRRLLSYDRPTEAGWP